MLIKQLFQLAIFTCSVLALPSMTHADDIKPPLSTSPCSKVVYREFFSQYSRVTFIEDPTYGGARWLCFEGKILTETRPSSNGGYYSFAFDNLEDEYLDEGGKYVKRNGKLVLLRMVVQEYTAGDADNRYWLIDFREKEPLVVGPMGGNDASREFRVIWNDQSVIVILDDDGYPLGSDGQPRGGDRPSWKKGEYKFVKNGDIKIELDGKQYPVLNKDGKYREKMGMLYRAYLYDYKKKQLIEAVIEDQH